MATERRIVSHQSRESTLDNKIQNQQSSLEGMMPESVSIVEKMQQAFLDSASAIVGKEVQDIKASLSVKMEVIEELDAGTHKYQVQYEDNNLIAYGMVGTSYSPGQIVQVLVPSGDFSEKLVIYDLYNAAAEAELTEEVVDTYILEENLITSNGDPYEDIKELHSWKEEEILIPFQKGFKDIFFEKTQDRKNFKMSFKVKTDIDGNHRTTGNYGMTLILPFRAPVYTIDPNTNKKVIQSYEEISETYTLDIHTMSGSVYDFKEYTYQEYNINLKEDWDFDAKRKIKCFLFVKDFNYTTEPTRTSGDILIKDIFFGSTRYLTEEELNGNSLSLNVSGGKYFVENSIKKIISPEYRVKGKVVKSLEGYECYWFVENVAIKVGSSGYNRIGGQGWECLNEQVIINYDSAGNSVYDWVTDQYSLTVEPTDVKNELEYKCVIVNNKGDLVQSRVTLKNLNSQYKIKINTSTGLYNYIPNIGEANIIVSIETSIKENYINTYWQRFDKDGKLVNTNFSLLRDFVKISGGDTGPYVYETEVSIPVKEIDTSTTIECTLSKEELDQSEGVTRYTNLGTVSISISATETPDYRLKIYNGDVCFKYDTNGNSPRLDAANYDGPLSTRVTQIDGLTWRLFKDTGQELNDEEYSLCKWEWKIPKSNTLITYQSGESDIKLNDYYIKSGNGYNPATDSGIIYDIANKYDLKKTNNTFILTVSFGEKTLSSTVTPTFLKDGANGTNGTRWSAAIKYHSSDGEEYGYGARDANGNPIKFQLAYYNNKWYIVSKEGLIEDETDEIEEEKTKDYLTISIYKDGEEIETPNEGTEEKYSIVWEVFDEKELNSLITVASSGSYNENCKIDIKKDGKKQTPVPFNDDSCNIVRAIVTVGNNSSIGSEQQGDDPLNTTEVIYAYYPIEIISVNGIIDKVSRIPNLDYGFDQVIYANDGTNPQYDNSHPFQVTSFNINNSELDSFDELEWSVNEKSNLKIKEKKNMTCSCVPFSKFESGQSKNYIKVKGKKRKDIATKIEELQGKIRIINDDKRWYENVPNYICDFCDKFNGIFNKSKIILSNSDNKQILEYRYQALQKIGQPSKENVKAKEFYSILEELFNECKENNIKIPKFTWQENEDPGKEDYYSSFNDSEYKKLVDKTRQEAYNYIIDTSPLVVSGIDTEIIGESYIKGNIKNIYNDYIIYRDIINTSISGLNSIDKSSDLYSIAEKIINYPDSMSGYDEGDHHLIKEQQMQILFDSLSLYKAFLQKPSGEEKDERYDKEGCEDFYSYSSIFQVLYRILSLVQKYNLETLNKIYAKKCDVLIEERNEIEKELEQYKSCQITSFTLIKPILFLTNYYGFSELNGWDGNKLYIDDNNGDYIIAPKVGAGQKENSKFTGMFMGVLKTFNNDKTSKYDKIGLLGLSGGEQTLFLNARNGSAIFGKSSSGQIVIDPTQSKALLYNSGFFEKYNNNGLPTSYGESNWEGGGMLIDLSTPEIRFGNGNFVVNSEGKITALGGGFIGGWNITDTTIESGGSQKKIVIDSNGTITKTTRIDEHGEEIVVKKEVTYDNKTKPKIYSEGHDVLITRDKDGHLDINRKGFYLSSDGIGIGDAFLVDANPDGEEITGQRLYLGKLNSKSRYWKISANETKNSSGDTIINSYISYNTEALDPIKKNSNNEELVGESLPEDPSSPGYVPPSSHDSGSDDEVTTPSESDSLPIDDEVEKPGGRISSDDNDIGTDDSDEGWGDYDSETGEIHREIGLVEDVSAPGRGGEGGLPRINYTDKEGKIYEYVYNSNSVYIGTDGLRIGNRFRVGPSEEGGFIDKLELGQLTANHWTIKSNGTDSYIAFGTTEKHFETDKKTNVITIDEKNAETSSVYIGTDGIRLGNKFAIDINGNVLSNFIVANAGGEIGGWTLDGKCLRSKETTDNKGWIKLDPVSGKISGGKENKTKWYINASGKAYFQDFVVEKTDKDDTVKINTGGWIIGQNTIQDNNNTVFITATEGGDGYIKLGKLYIGGANVGSDSIGLNTDCFLKFESEVIKYGNKEIAVRGVYTVKKNKDEAGNPSGDIVGYVKI